MGEYRALKKDVVNCSEAAENRRKIFVEKLDSLFDISHASAQAIIKSKKIAMFLLDQQSIRVFKARDLNIVKRTGNRCVGKHNIIIMIFYHLA
jgi:hypothetical protein